MTSDAVDTVRILFRAFDTLVLAIGLLLFKMAILHHSRLTNWYMLRLKRTAANGSRACGCQTRALLILKMGSMWLQRSVSASMYWETSDG